MSVNAADRKAREALHADYQEARVAASNALQSVVSEINTSEANHSASMVGVWATDATQTLIQLGAKAEAVRTFDWLHRND